MIAPLTTLLATLLLGCGAKDVRTYDNSVFQLASAYNAKIVCSCVFVAGRDEESCQRLAAVSPAVAGFKVDRDAATVTSKALGGWKRIARYEGPETGCVLDAD